MDAFDFSNVYRCKECPFITTDSWVCELHKKIRETFTILYGPYLRLNTIMDHESCDYEFIILNELDQICLFFIIIG